MAEEWTRRCERLEALRSRYAAPELGVSYRWQSSLHHGVGLRVRPSSRVRQIAVKVYEDAGILIIQWEVWREKEKKETKKELKSWRTDGWIIKRSRPA